MRELLEASGRTYGSPRIHADLIAEGWRVGINTVADSMRRQGLQGRTLKRRRCLKDNFGDPIHTHTCLSPYRGG